MTITKGLVHNYLGMAINYSTQDKVKFYMTEYINKMLIDLLPNFDGEAATAAAIIYFPSTQKQKKWTRRECKLLTIT
eukprot:5862203-Ditylum_brightwellii.AAC.1